MAKKDSGFMSYKPSSLESVLTPDPTNRLLRKDIERRQNLPFFIAGGAQKTGIIDVQYFANASAGNFSNSVDLTSLSLVTQPLALVWYMGSYVSKNGPGTGPFTGGGLVPGDASGGGTVLNGMSIHFTAKASYSVTTTDLTVSITSLNVGWTDFLGAQFFYALYYDTPDIASERITVG